MKNNKYTFGDITFEVESPFKLQENGRCEAFRSEKETDYLVRVVDVGERAETDCKPEKNGNVFTRYMRSCPVGLSVTSLLATSDIAFVFPDHDAFILHASYIIYNRMAILFTAPSGTGKTTQAKYWEAERGAEIVNGDRVLITRRNGKFYANGIYVCGTSGISKNVTAPIEAVVLLEQGESNVQKVVPSRMLFLRILCECSYDMQNNGQYEKITELVSDMINSVPTLCYSCQKSPESVEALEKILWKKE